MGAEAALGARSPPLQKQDRFQQVAPNQISSWNKCVLLLHGGAQRTLRPWGIAAHSREGFFPVLCFKLGSSASAGIQP